MCVVSAEAFYKDPKSYLLRAQRENITVVTDVGSFLIQPRIPNAETIAALEEGDMLLKDPNAKRYNSVEELFADMDTELAKEDN